MPEVTERTMMIAPSSFAESFRFLNMRSLPYPKFLTPRARGSRLQLWRRYRGVHLVLAVADFELLDEAAQTGRHLCQFVRRLLRFLRTRRCPLRCFCYSRYILRDLRRSL